MGHRQEHTSDTALERVSQRRGLKKDKVPAMKGSGGESDWAEATACAKIWRWKSREARVAGVRGQGRERGPIGHQKEGGFFLNAMGTMRSTPVYKSPTLATLGGSSFL